MLHFVVICIKKEEKKIDTIQNSLSIFIAFLTNPKHITSRSQYTLVADYNIVYSLCALHVECKILCYDSRATAKHT